MGMPRRGIMRRTTVAGDWQSVVKVRLHSTSDASSQPALLLLTSTDRILSRRALPTRRLARLGATPDFHHGLLASRAS